MIVITKTMVKEQGAKDYCNTPENNNSYWEKPFHCNQCDKAFTEGE